MDGVALEIGEYIANTRATPLARSTGAITRSERFDGVIVSSGFQNYGACAMQSHISLSQYQMRAQQQLRYQHICTTRRRVKCRAFPYWPRQPYCERSWRQQQETCLLKGIHEKSSSYVHEARRTHRALAWHVKNSDAPNGSNEPWAPATLVNDDGLGGIADAVCTYELLEPMFSISSNARW